MRLVAFVLLIVVGTGVVSNASSEPTSVQSKVESLSRAQTSPNIPPRIRIPTSTRRPQPETKIPTTTSRPQQGTGVPTASMPLFEGEKISTTTQRAPVYVPLKEKEGRTTTRKPNVKISNIRKNTEAEKPSLSSALKKGTEEQVLQKKSPEKNNDSTDLAERNDEVAENKEGFFSAVNMPLALSIGTAIMFGGLAYYMQSDPEPITSRKGIPPHLGYDHGVRIVRPSDLTPAELDRLVNVGGYRVSGRSLTHSAHPYFDYAKQVYKYIMPEILGGSSKEDIVNEKVYIVRHHHHHEKNEHEKELEKFHGTVDGEGSPEEDKQPTAPISADDHPYNRIVKKNMPKI